MRVMSERRTKCVAVTIMRIAAVSAAHRPHGFDVQSSSTRLAVTAAAAAATVAPAASYKFHNTI